MIKEHPIASLVGLLMVWLAIVLLGPLLIGGLAFITVFLAAPLGLPIGKCIGNIGRPSPKSIEKAQRQAKIEQLEVELEITPEARYAATERAIEEIEQKLHPDWYKTDTCGGFLYDARKEMGLGYFPPTYSLNYCDKETTLKLTPKGDKFEGDCPKCGNSYSLKNPKYVMPIEEEQEQLQKKLLAQYAVPSHIIREEVRTELNDLVRVLVPPDPPNRTYNGVMRHASGHVDRYDFQSGGVYHVPRVVADAFWKEWSSITINDRSSTIEQENDTYQRLLERREQIDRAGLDRGVMTARKRCRYCRSSVLYPIYFQNGVVTHECGTCGARQ